MLYVMWRTVYHISTPAGIWCKNDVVLTLMRRDDVAATLIRRHFRTLSSRRINVDPTSFSHKMPAGTDTNFRSFGPVVLWGHWVGVWFQSVLVSLAGVDVLLMVTTRLSQICYFRIFDLKYIHV